LNLRQVRMSNVYIILFSVGRNDTGQLGHGDTNRRDIPTLIDSLSGYNVVNASCGKGHTLFLTGRHGWLFYT